MCFFFFFSYNKNKFKTRKRIYKKLTYTSIKLESPLRYITRPTDKMADRLSHRVAVKLKNGSSY